MVTMKPFPSAFSICLLFLTNLFTTILAAVPSTSYSLSSPFGDQFDLALNVPSPNQDDDLYFHVNTNSPAAWIAFGFGTQMANSLIFVMYASADGNNVTVSPRLGLGHVMPEHTSDVQVEVLAGSGVADGNFIVNARCTGCRTWSGSGSIDIKSTSQPMIWAVNTDDSLESNDLDATITQHSHEDTFNINLAQAVGAAGVPSVTANTNDGSDSFGNGDDDGNGFDNGNTLRRLHAVFMVGSFLIGFPFGYLLLRVFDSVKIHAAIQSLAAFIVVIGGLGTGIAMSVRQNISPKLNAPHQIIGFVVVALVLTAWTLGLLGHLQFRKTGAPAPPMKVHRILGPATILVGLVNCAIGFHFADNTHAIVFFIIVSVVMILIVTSVTLCMKRRKSRTNVMNTPAAQNFRQGQMEPQYAGAAPPYQESVPLQNFGAAGVAGPGRPQPYTSPSYQSDGGYNQGTPAHI